ncbi:MAG: hypothetical protein LBS36_04400 [Oscillospiraceae bacterium]|jgi:glycerophosphoryl diester phosphodiesterase|nr:hypothetical protein [Oscillospiraceae bacterium]
MAGIFRKAGKSAVILFCFVLAAVGLVYFVVTRETAEPVVAAVSKNPYIMPVGSPLVAAHRSGGGLFPENTLNAFERCVNSDDFRTDIFEFDLHLTKDDVLVVLHDGTLDRTSDAVEYFGKKDIRASDYSFAELRALNMGENYVAPDGSRPYAGLRGKDIPENLRVVRVEEVFDFLEKHGKFSYIIDIKDGGERGKRATDVFYAILSEKKLLGRVFAASFHGEINRYQHEAYPDMMRSAGPKEVLKIYLYSLFGISAEPGTFTFDALQIPDDSYVINLATTRFINYAHKHDIAVQYWTINDEEKMNSLKEKGADAIITDLPDVAYALVHEQAAAKR